MKKFNGFRIIAAVFMTVSLISMNVFAGLSEEKKVFATWTGLSGALFLNEKVCRSLAQELVAPQIKNKVSFNTEKLLKVARVSGVLGRIAAIPMLTLAGIFASVVMVELPAEMLVERKRDLQRNA